MQGEGQMAGLFSIFSSDNEVEAAETAEPDLAEFWEVWEHLEDKFASATTSTISVEDRVEGAISGLVDSYGDPYTVYMPPAVTENFNETISGEFSGVGMEVGMRNGLVSVIAPLPGTPAEGAGIIAGDIIVQIDEESTEGMSIDQAVKLIRGEKGTEVVLKVYRDGESEFLDIPIIRDTIDIPTVKSEQFDDVYYLAIYSFNAVAEKQVRESLQDYLESDATKLVIDVRGNPGGYLQSAVGISSYFLPAGKVVVQEQFGDSSKDDVFRSRGRQIQLFTPKDLVVLVDNGSASASEILAGALRDHGVATVIGSQTFGKGSVQEVVDLDKGSSLKVTVARWLTPEGTSISEGGLKPDIVISRTPAQRIAGEDPQKDAALRFLAGEEVVSESFEDQIESNATTTEEAGE
jgi:carboxyl-terminal processing protease